jgi:hypothetical protein
VVAFVVGAKRIAGTKDANEGGSEMKETPFGGHSLNYQSSPAAVDSIKNAEQAIKHASMLARHNNNNIKRRERG